MISLWEILQGLLFMVTFGGLTRMAMQRPEKPASAPLPAAQAVSIPFPRVAPQEEHETLPTG